MKQIAAFRWPSGRSIRNDQRGIDCRGHSSLAITSSFKRLPRFLLCPDGLEEKLAMTIL
jgi:hypothetical protein